MVTVILKFLEITVYKWNSSFKLRIQNFGLFHITPVQKHLAKLLTVSLSVTIRESMLMSKNWVGWWRVCRLCSLLTRSARGSVSRTCCSCRRCICSICVIRRLRTPNALWTIVFKLLYLQTMNTVFTIKYPWSFYAPLVGRCFSF